MKVAFLAMLLNIINTAASKGVVRNETRNRVLQHSSGGQCSAPRHTLCSAV